MKDPRGAAARAHDEAWATEPAHAELADRLSGHATALLGQRHASQAISDVSAMSMIPNAM